MSNLKIDLSVPANSKKLFEIATDFENFKNFSPTQIKNILTEDLLVMMNVLENTRSEIGDKPVNKIWLNQLEKECSDISDELKRRS